MTFLKLIIPATTLTAILFVAGTADISWAEAQASTITEDTIPARDAATSYEDITLTNKCIDGGKEKIYCLCMTKIFKNEMSLRQYRAAAILYNEKNMAISQDLIADKGYSIDEVSAINMLGKELSSDGSFRKRCDKAEIYFAAAIEG